jgi:hypothetical protein
MIQNQGGMLYTDQNNRTELKGNYYFVSDDLPRQRHCRVVPPRWIIDCICYQKIRPLSKYFH